MLKIKQKFRIQPLNGFRFLPRRLQFSRQIADNDELITAIDTDMLTHDDNWQLTERPDTTKLVEYWDKVEDDIQHDPEWISISED